MIGLFNYASNTTTGYYNFAIRVIAAIPDRQIANSQHVMFYEPVDGGEGRVWLNNNLGADYANTTKASFNPANQATTYNDTSAFGSLYQWGRYSDGHELFNHTTRLPYDQNVTAILSSSDTPNNSWYISTSTGLSDWRNPQNNNLWQGVAGINNPCPVGYRIPTSTELTTLTNNRNPYAVGDRYQAISNSSVKFPSAGYRDKFRGDLLQGNTSNYWTSTINGTKAGAMYLTDLTLLYNIYDRGFAFPCRCIKD